MPFTPYHFGPSGFVGLLFKRRLDLPTFLLTNVAIDFEVLFQITHLTGTPLTHWNFPHQVFHFHTLLIGGLVGVVLGLALFPFRGIFEWFMEKLRLPYKPTAFKMVFSGLLGVWFHVLIDGAYHWDVQMFWPNKHLRPLWNLLHRPEIITQTQIKYICLAFAAAAVCLYIFLLAKTLKKKSQQ
jgi:hypothetical protein